MINETIWTECVGAALLLTNIAIVAARGAGSKGNEYDDQGPYGAKAHRH
jgi:hypothetical protein